LKYILLLVLVFFFSNADEIKRIELIVNDITKLREQYKVCQKELNAKKNPQIKKHKCQNASDKDKQKIKKLKNQIKKYKKLLKTKDKEIKKLKSRKISKKSNKKSKICKPQKLDKPNKFPKLILKNEHLKYKIVKIKAATYRLKTKANIYNGINDKNIETWDKGTSFTTNVKAKLLNEDSWFRITGFFIEGTWVKAQSQMWIKTKFVKKR